MKIIVDENIPFAKEAFGLLGEVTTCAGRELTAEAVRDAELLMVRSVTQLNEALLAGSRVRFVGSATTGIDHIDLSALERLGIGFAHAPGANANSVAEYVVAQLLHISLQLGMSLTGQTIGVIGVGEVGLQVTAKCQALGMNVIGNDPPLARQTKSSQYRPLEELFERADFVTLHVPLTSDGPDATFGMVDGQFLQRLKPGAIFINTARGKAASDDALLAALDNGQLAAVALDVWETEPEINLALLKRAALSSPHIAGYSFDGKLLGTRMIYEAAGRFLGASNAWDSAPLMPQAPMVQLEIDCQAKSDEQALAEAIVPVCGILSDDRRLRAAQSTELPAAVRAANFDHLRRTYPLRREFPHTTLTLHNATSALRQKFHALGFCLKPKAVSPQPLSRALKKRAFSAVNKTMSKMDEDKTFPADRSTIPDSSPKHFDRLGPYQILKRVGKGGMGEVYLGLDPDLDRYVALKTLRQDLPEVDSCLERFRREARTIANLNHPGIVPIHHIGNQDDIVYFAMEYVGENSLATLLKEKGKLPVAEALNFTRQAAEALGYAAAKGIIHRDIKPGNLLLTKKGKVKVCDFGLAKGASGSALDEDSLTVVGSIMGSPHYMSPEQSRGHEADQRSDIYSLGATLYNLVSGKPPFEKPSKIDVLLAHISEPTPRPAELLSVANGRLIELIEKMMAKKTTERHQDYDELLRDIDQVYELLEPESAPLAMTPAAAYAQTERMPNSFAQKGEKKTKRKLVWAVVIVLALAGASIAIFTQLDTSWHKPSSDNNSAQPTATPTPALDDNSATQTELAVSGNLDQLRQELQGYINNYQYTKAIELLKNGMDNKPLSEMELMVVRQLIPIFNQLLQFKLMVSSGIERHQPLSIKRQRQQNELTIIAATTEEITVSPPGRNRPRKVSWDIFTPAELQNISRKCLDLENQLSLETHMLFSRVYNLQEPGARRAGFAENSARSFANRAKLQRGLSFLRNLQAPGAGQRRNRPDRK